MKILDRARIKLGNKLHRFTTEGELIAEAADAELELLDRRFTAEVRMLAARIDGLRGALPRGDEA